MASILRSSKFVRYIAGFTRNVLNAPREFDGNFVNVNQTHCLCSGLARGLAAQTSSQYDQNYQNLEYRLRTIDQDVRKSGRISRRDIEDVLEEIRSTRSATSSQSLLVIRCCGNLVPEELPEIRTKLVQEIWNTLNKLNVPMDVSHYNALLRVYLENEHPFSPTEFLSEMENKGVEPNRVTYQRLIARYCQTGDIEGATKILEFMREKQLPVNESVFNALIVGHSEAGDMDSAQDMLNVMSQAGLEPSADTYTTLLCGYAKKGDIDKMRTILEECETKDILLLDKDYLDIVYALATNGHSDKISSILSRVRKAVGYNQDAMNVIFRLINKDQTEAAFQVMKTMIRNTRPDGTTLPIGSFFIKQLVKANKPAETIVTYCDKLEAENMYDRGLLLANESAIESGNETLALSLMEELQKRGQPIRQHFFWPLIVSKAKEDPTGRKVIDILNKMSSFNLTPNNETLRDYVIPNLKGKSSEILAVLREANIPVGTAASSLVIRLLQRNEIHEAALIASTVPAYYQPDALKRCLTNSFYRTKDLESYITILRAVHDNLERKSILASEKTDSDPVTALDKSEVIGSLVLDLASNKNEFNLVIEPVLKELVNQGLSLSTTAAESIEDSLKEKMTENISSLLGKLTSGELSPVPIQKKPPTYTPANQMNIPQLERYIQNMKSKGNEVRGLERQLLTVYYRARDLTKMESLLEELKSKDFKMTTGLYAQLIDLYAYHQKVDKAVENYEALKAFEGEKFSLDQEKLVRLAHCLVKAGRFEEAMDILKNTRSEQKDEDRGYSYSATVWRLLNYLAEEGRVEDLDRAFNTLLENGLLDVTNNTLGPLIKVHILRKDWDKALEKFEWCVKKYKLTPWKNELACHLIQAEDAENLQKITDLSTSVHGEINSLYDLVFAFVECGRVRQARKILETPGLQNRPQKINYACERYQQEGKVTSLEGLKDATKNLNHIDRTDIYYQLLLTYVKQEEIDKALGLWTQMQEEDIPPGDEFLITLGNFLKNRGREVPFVIPDVRNQKAPEPQPQFSKESVRPQQILFKQKLRTQDIDACLEMLHTSRDKFSVSDVSLLIEKLLQSARLQEATKIFLDVLEKGSMPIHRITKFMLNKLAVSGNVETLQLIGSKLGQTEKKLVSFDNRLCHAFLIAGKSEEYLNNLEKEIDSATDAELENISEKFPRGGAHGILEKHPELVEKYESVALKYAKRGIVSPVNVLWIHYFIEGNEKAENIWNSYIKDSPRIMFQRIVQTARERVDEDLVRRLLDQLKQTKVSDGAKGNAYSCLLDVLVAKGKEEEAINSFVQAVKEVPITTINRTAVIRIRDACQKLNKPFNYEIPPKNTKSTSYKEETEDM